MQVILRILRGYLSLKWPGPETISIAGDSFFSGSILVTSLCIHCITQQTFLKLCLSLKFLGGFLSFVLLFLLVI